MGAGDKDTVRGKFLQLRDLVRHETHCKYWWRREQTSTTHAEVRTKGSLDTSENGLEVWSVRVTVAAWAADVTLVKGPDCTARSSRPLTQGA